jgi:hypothetical protein
VGAENNNCGDMILASGANYLWELSNATGLAGSGWDVLNVTGSLDVQSTVGSPFTINLATLNGAVAGPAANFDNNSTSVWTIATATVGISNFAASKFVVNDSQFANDLGGGAFNIEEGSLNIRFAPNHAPVAPVVTYARPPGFGLKIRISDLLTNTSDADGDIVRLESLMMTTTNGITITTNETFIFYTNSNGLVDAFNYTVADNHAYRAGDQQRLTTGTIVIDVLPPSSTNQNVVSFTVVDGKPTMVFAGIPGYEYDVERTPSLTEPIVWTPIHTTNAPAGGLFEFTDQNPLPQGFYRTAQH